MPFIKRFAFWPLLAIACATVASAVSNADKGSTSGVLVGLAASIPIAALVDYRRRHKLTR